MIEKFVVSRDDSTYEAWPDLEKITGDKLICVFTECTHHGNRDNSRIVYSISEDRGRTWQAKIPLTSYTNKDYHWNCPRIVKLKDNRLVIICDKTGNEQRTQVFLWFSHNNGDTWEGPIGTRITGIVPDKLVELSSGRWLIGTHTRVRRYLRQAVYISDDAGNTWQGPVTIARRRGLHLCEGSIMELEDESLVCFMRENSHKGRDCYKAISKDHGMTWNGPYRMPIPGCHRPVAGYLQSEAILMTYRFIQGGMRGWGHATQNFFAALFDDTTALAVDRDNQSVRIMPIDYDRSLQADLGYSGWIQFDDGEIYIVTYLVDDAPKGQIRGYVLHEDDFYLIP